MIALDRSRNNEVKVAVEFGWGGGKASLPEGDSKEVAAEEVTLAFRKCEERR